MHIRLPNITGKTAEEQAQQMKSYLTQLAGELNWALGNLQGVESAGYEPHRSSNQGGSEGNLHQKAEDVLQNFNDLKGLIIKSADIVNAYYDEINTRLAGLYVAQSEYGAFVEKTTATITETSKNTTTNYENIQILAGNISDTKDVLDGNIDSAKDTLDQSIKDAKDDLKGDIDSAKKDLSDSISDAEKGLNDSIGKAKEDLEKEIADAEERLKDLIDSSNAILIEVQAHTRSGLLYYDDSGIPIYGFEVGQRNLVNGQEVFNQYARFTANKLSFYDHNGDEVAYISDKKLFIKNAEIRESIKHGGFEDTVMDDKSVVTKWIGGG
jgi:hypothetical protein